MSSDEEAVSSRKKMRGVVKRKKMVVSDEEEEDRPTSSSKSKKKVPVSDDEQEDQPTSSRRSRPSGKAKSPERKKKERKEAEPRREEIHVDAQYVEEDDEEEEGDGVGDEDDDVTGDGSPSMDEEENARERLERGSEDDVFEIPSRDDDLLFAGKAGYKVLEKVDLEEAITAVEQFEDEIAQQRWRCLYERFPAFFTLVRSPSTGTRAEVPAAVRSRLVTSLILTYTHMTPYMKQVLAKAASGVQNKKLRSRCRDLSDHVLMLIYLLHKLVVIFEDEAKSNKRKPAKKGGKGRPKKGKVVQNDDGDMLSASGDEFDAAAAATEDESTWDESRQKVLETLTELVNTTVANYEGKTCEFAIRHLWKGGLFDRQALMHILQIATKFLENPDIIKSRNVLHCVFKLVRALCINTKHFSYIGGVLFMTLFGLDYYKESSVTAYPFIRAIIDVSTDVPVDGEKKEMDRLLEEMLNYFGKTKIAVSPNNAKALTLFLKDMADQKPLLLFFRFSPVLQLLSDENASVRSAVLRCIVSVLCAKFLDPLQKVLSQRFANARMTLFRTLIKHVRDVNANVRACALKCLYDMAVARKIPTDLLRDGLLQMVGQRITDDKIAVRKEAVKFASTFLTNNPFGHDFTKAVNEKKLKELIVRRDELRKDVENGDDAEKQSVDAAERVFESFRPALLKKVEEYAEEVMLDTFEIPQEEERRAIFRGFNDRQEENQHGGGLRLPSQGDTDEFADDLSMRWLFTMILSEECVTEVKAPARLLVGMAVTDQLKGEHLTKKYVLSGKDPIDVLAKRIVEAGHFLFVNTAAMIIGKNEETILQREKDLARRKEKIKTLSKDIDDLFMKLVLEKEFAMCLPLVMSSVMAGDSNELKPGIEFVIKCKDFGISGSEVGVRQLCALVWKSDDEGRNSILQTAGTLFRSCHPDRKKRNAATAENLLNLVRSMSDHERGSVEQVLSLTIKFDPLEPEVYDLLWREVDEDSIKRPTEANPPPLTKEQEKERKHQLVAMKAICMLARSEVKLSRTWLRRFQHIIREGWPEICSEALVCIANLASRYTKDEKKDAKPFRIPMSDSLFKHVEQFLLAELCRPEARTWYRSLRATLDIYFHVCKESSAAVSGLVAKVLWLLRRTSQALHYYDQQVGDPTMRAPTPSRTAREEATYDPAQKSNVAEDRIKHLTVLWTTLLERLCVLTGEVATRMLVHADYTFVREFCNAKETILKKEPVPFPRRNLEKWEMQSLCRQGIWDWGTGNKEDEELTGLSEEDRIREIARDLVDEQLIETTHAKNIQRKFKNSENQNPRTLLGRLLPIIVHSVRAKGTPPRVRFQALSALAKMMLISPVIAQCGSRYFFAHLAGGSSEILRSNLAVIAADLTFRHPNLVENHSGALFLQLKDEDSCVRETCFLILNHLISNDLLKNNPELSSALFGIVDDEPSIQLLARGLFHEWSKKEGVMNHVPSFISRLAADARSLSLESFKAIMNMFLPLILERKDADVQGFVFKLCKRIEYAKNPSVKVQNPDLPAYISHCMSLLTLNVKAFRKLNDHRSQFMCFVGDTRVYEDILGIVKVFQKEHAKAGHEVLPELAKFLIELDESHEKYKTETAVQGMVDKMKLGKKGAGGGEAARKQGRGRPRAAITASSATPTPAKIVRPQRGTAKKRGRIIESDEDSE